MQGAADAGAGLVAAGVEIVLQGLGADVEALGVVQGVGAVHGVSRSMVQGVGCGRRVRGAVASDGGIPVVVTPTEDIDRAIRRNLQWGRYGLIKKAEGVIDGSVAISDEIVREHR
ncbi:hypothetical protein GCM10007860_27370 [Chitiniphilus shinanonensis]|uniref:Uncharacterized protein n=1 Tax=Chitiniphilus shinanonensis TaxID=553088 RepID=A0ABQ6BUA4_9NEIS|nr:hypothetical protein GCM10007860_27370 [Chitiniphilus shinanonensis]